MKLNHFSVKHVNETESCDNYKKLGFAMRIMPVQLGPLRCCYATMSRS